MQMTAFWDVVPCSLKADRRFIVLMMEAECTSETSIYFHETTRRYIPESRHFHTRRRDSLKFHILSN
jgi:hypothetical protein